VGDVLVNGGQLGFSFREQRNPLPMQYLGSKARISSWILGEIRRTFPGVTTFVDAFSGTGVVALAASRDGYAVVANDTQEYSYLLLRALLTCPRDGLLELAGEVEVLERELLASGRTGAHGLLEMEQSFLDGRMADWRAYRKFCQSTPLVDGSPSITAELREANEWNLFIKYYANTYFGVRQCLEIDTIREHSSALDADLRDALLGATISAMSFTVSSTTHLAQYLKPTTRENTAHLLTKRRMSIIREVVLRLRYLNQFPLPSKQAIVLNDDYETALADCKLGPATVMYADPPYFKEHYSRYYHVLDTFARYDYPELTYNSRLKRVTVGRYRKERYASPFGLKAKAPGAFQELFRFAHMRGFKLALSYASTSLVDGTTVEGLATESGYTVDRRSVSLVHSGQGQPRHREVSENLYLMELDGSHR